jgi:hypothetical protein
MIQLRTTFVRVCVRVSKCSVADVTLKKEGNERKRFTSRVLSLNAPPPQKICYNPMASYFGVKKRKMRAKLVENMWYVCYYPSVIAGE